jgi:hypothetical protein
MGGAVKIPSRGIEQRSVTPEEAADLLKRNASNRQLREDRVELYVRELVDGNWGFADSMIVIGRDGVLKNGQHRLTAIVKSNVTMPNVTIQWDAPNDAQKYADRNRPRSGVDDLRIAGVKNALEVSAITSLLVRYEDDKTLLSSSVRNRIISPSEREIAMAVYPEVFEAAHLVVHLRSGLGNARLGSHAAVGFVFTLGLRRFHEETRQFVELIRTGEDPNPSSPTRRLRDHFLGGRASGQTLTVAAIVIKAFNDFLSGTTRKSPYQWRADEKFPELGPSKNGARLAR